MPPSTLIWKHMKTTSTRRDNFLEPHYSGTRPTTFTTTQLPLVLEGLALSKPEGQKFLRCQLSKYGRKKVTPKKKWISLHRHVPPTPACRVEWDILLFPWQLQCQQLWRNLHLNREPVWGDPKSTVETKLRRSLPPIFKAKECLWKGH